MAQNMKIRVLIFVVCLLLALIPLQQAFDMLDTSTNPDNVGISFFGTIEAVYVADYNRSLAGTVYEVYEIDGAQTISFSVGKNKYRKITDLPVVGVGRYGEVRSWLYGPGAVTVTAQYGVMRCLNKTIPFTFPGQNKRYLATLYRMPIWVVFDVVGSKETARTAGKIAYGLGAPAPTYFGRVSVGLNIKILTRLNSLYFVCAVFSDIKKYTNWTATTSPEKIELVDTDGDGLAAPIIHGSYWYKISSEGEVWFHPVVNDTVPAERNGKPLEYPRNPEKFETLWKANGVEFLLDAMLAPPTMEIDFMEGIGERKERAWGNAVAYVRIDAYFAWVTEVQEGEDYGGESPEDIYANIADFVPAVIETKIVPWAVKTDSDLIYFAILAIAVIIIVLIVLGVIFRFLFGGSGVRVVVGGA